MDRSPHHRPKARKDPCRRAGRVAPQAHCDPARRGFLVIFWRRMEGGRGSPPFCHETQNPRPSLCAAPGVS